MALNQIKAEVANLFGQNIHNKLLQVFALESPPRLLVIAFFEMLLVKDFCFF
jgi:hypothetical protein